MVTMHITVYAEIIYAQITLALTFIDSHDHAMMLLYSNTTIEIATVVIMIDLVTPLGHFSKNRALLDFHRPNPTNYA